MGTDDPGPAALARIRAGNPRIKSIRLRQRFLEFEQSLTLWRGEEEREQGEEVEEENQKVTAEKKTNSGHCLAGNTKPPEETCRRSERMGCSLSCLFGSSALFCVVGVTSWWKGVLCGFGGFGDSPQALQSDSKNRNFIFEPEKTEETRERLQSPVDLVSLLFGFLHSVSPPLPSIIACPCHLLHQTKYRGLRKISHFFLIVSCFLYPLSSNLNLNLSSFFISTLKLRKLMLMAIQSKKCHLVFTSWLHVHFPLLQT